MGNFTVSIESNVEAALERLQAALEQLQNLNVVVGLERATTGLGARTRHALGGRRGKKSRGENAGTHTVTVNYVRSRLGYVEPFGHATISLDGETAVGLEPDSTGAAVAGLAEDMLSGGFPHPVAAHVERDHRAAKDSATIRITKDQADKIRSLIDPAKTSPQAYDFLYQNCAEWVEEVLQAAWVDAPRDITPDGLVKYLKAKYSQQ